MESSKESDMLFSVQATQKQDIKETIKKIYFIQRLSYFSFFNHYSDEDN